MPQKQKLSLEEKVEIMEEYLRGNIGLREAARRVGIVPDTISQWARNYEADGIDIIINWRDLCMRIWSAGPPDTEPGHSGACAKGMTQVSVSSPLHAG